MFYIVLNRTKVENMCTIMKKRGCVTFHLAACFFSLLKFGEWILENVGENTWPSKTL